MSRKKSNLSEAMEAFKKLGNRKEVDARSFLAIANEMDIAVEGSSHEPRTYEGIVQLRKAAGKKQPSDLLCSGTSGLIASMAASNKEASPIHNLFTKHKLAYDVDVGTSAPILRTELAMGARSFAPSEAAAAENKKNANSPKFELDTLDSCVATYRRDFDNEQFQEISIEDLDELLQDIADYFARCEFELLLWVSTGCRPSVTACKWQDLQQKDFEVETKPSRHIAEWQTLEEMLYGAEVNYSKAKRTSCLIKALGVMMDYLYADPAEECRVEPAGHLIPGYGGLIENPFRKYTLLVSDTSALKLKNCPEWQDRQTITGINVSPGKGVKHGESIGRYGNLEIIANSNTPHFGSDGKKFSRGLLLGEHAMVIARVYDTIKFDTRRIAQLWPNVDMRRLYRLWTYQDEEKLNQPKYIFAEASFAVQKMTCKREGSDTEMDCGIVAIDMCED